MQQVPAATLPNGHLSAEPQFHSMADGSATSSGQDWSVGHVDSDILLGVMDGESCSEEQAAGVVRGVMSAVLEYRKRRGDLSGPLLAPVDGQPECGVLEAPSSLLIGQVHTLMAKVGTGFFVPLELTAQHISSRDTNTRGSKAASSLEAADIWAAGSLLYYLLSMRTLWPPVAAHEAEHQIVRDEGMVDLFSHPWHLVAPEARHLLARMLRLEPGMRPSAAQVIENDWVQGRACSRLDGVKANGGKGLHDVKAKAAAPSGAIAQEGDVMPRGAGQQLFNAKGSPLEGWARGLVGRKPKAAFSADMRVEEDRSADKERGERGIRGVSWRRGSTDFEVFSSALAEPEGAQGGVKPPQAALPNAPWKLTLEAGGLERHERESDSGNQPQAPLERSTSGGSVVERAHDSPEPQRPASRVEQGSGQAASQPVRTTLRSSLKSSLKVRSTGQEAEASEQVSPYPLCTNSSATVAEEGSIEEDPGSVGPTARAQDGEAPQAQAREGNGGEGSKSGDESELQKLRAKRRAERAASVQFSTLPARGYAKPVEGGEGGGGDEAETVQLESKAGAKTHRSIRDLFPTLDDRSSATESSEGPSTPSKVASAPSPTPGTSEVKKEETGRRGLMRITSSTAAESFLWKSRGKDKESSGSFKESSGKDPDGPIVRTRRTGSTVTPDTAAPSSTGNWPRKPMLGSLRSLIKRSNSESRQQQSEAAPEEVSTDYAAALALASRKVERELLNSVRPGRRAIPMPSSKDATTLPEKQHVAPAQVVKGADSSEAAPLNPVEGEVPKEADPNTVEVDELVGLVEVGDRQVGNLLEDFSAMLIKEQEEAAKSGGATEEMPLPPLPLLDDLNLEGEDTPERQSMIIDGMGRRLLQGPMAHPHPRRKHGRSSHVFC